MKRIIALLLCLCFFVTLCGCDVKSMFEDFSISQVFAEIKSQILGFGTEGQTIEIVEEYYVSSPEFDSCYNVLNSKQRKIYKKLYSAAETMPDGFVKLCTGYDGVYKDISLAYKAVLNDHAEIFWMPDTYLLGNNKSVNDSNIYIAFNYSDDTKEASYVVPIEERDKMRSELQNEVTKILVSISITDDEYEKEKLINDYICANTEYNKEAEFSNTAYGCIVLKQALCEGYARAFKLLCNEAGIECELVLGLADGVGHMWNAVNIDGMHNYVDVTWNDQNDNSYAYFNITQKQLEFDHVIAPTFKERTAEEIIQGKQFNFTFRKCTYTGNTFYRKENRVIDYINEYDYAEFIAQVITKQAGNGVYSAEFLLESESLIEKFNNENDAFLYKIQYRLDDFVINGYLFERDVLTLFYEVAD